MSEELTSTGGSEAPRASEKIEPIAPRPSLLFLVVVSAVSLAADLGSKWWAKSTLDDPTMFGGRKIDVIQGKLAFIFARNRGGAWGLLQDESEAVRRPFFLLISAAAVLFIVTLYRRVTPQQTALKWGLPLVLGGALGNLVDRVRYGYVVDFIDVHVTPTFRWPTFNIADIAIVAGVALMAIDMFTARKPEPAAAAAAAAAPDAAVKRGEGAAGEAAPVAIAGAGAGAVAIPGAVADVGAGADTGASSDAEDAAGRAPGDDGVDKHKKAERGDDDVGRAKDGPASSPERA
jgi:signal peptidase II